MNYVVGETDFFKQMLYYASAARHCRLSGAGSPLTAEEVHCVSQPHEKRGSCWPYGLVHVTRDSITVYGSAKV